MKLVIKYKPKRLRINLFLGLMWLVFGIIQIIATDMDSWLNYGYLVCAILYLTLYLYEFKNQYLTIQDGQMRENHFFGKKIDLTKVTQFRHFAGEYIFKTEKQKLKIDTQIIDEESLKELNEELEKLNLKKTSDRILKNA